MNSRKKEMSMNFLKQIFTAPFLRSRCRWPSPLTLRVYWIVAGLLSLYATGDVTISQYRQALAHGLSGWPLFQTTALTALAVLLISGLYTLTLLLMWGLYYRLFTDIVGGIRQFLAWLPGAFQGFLRGARAVIAFLLSIPSLIAGFFRAIGRGFAWLAGRPAWWRSLSSKDKTASIASAVTLSAYLGFLAGFYPIACRLSAMLPTWAPMSDVPLLQALFIDMFLGSIIAVILISVAATILGALIKRKRNS
ncbi:MAG: hypothetical protein JST01_23385 [Cyanobacteria bacterium SZAS TMP-1]|nr:hypothetical protein [Cyanobacteria bacterium SZAS TMP-1]